MKILLTGATGYVGGHLGAKLVELGHEVVSLTRNKNQSLGFESRLIELDDLPSESGVEAVIHLAGASVAAKRWTADYKRQLVSSRVAFTRKILQALDYEDLQVFLQASATGYYPSSKDQVLTERSDSGKGFLSQLCVDWEEASSQIDCRKAYFRIGMVMGRHSPAMQKMQPLFEKRLGAVLGGGNQYMSWVHIEDLVNIFVAALEDHNYSGVYNAVAPHALTNKAFTRLMAQAVGKSVVLPPAPSFALRLMYGEMSQILLDSHNAKPENLIKQGFAFKYENMEEALKDSV